MLGEEESLGPGCRFGPLAFSGDTIELGQRLGEGASAVVYEGTRLHSPEPLAVKIIDVRRLGALSCGDTAQKRLETEVRILREADHPRCVGLKDIYRSRKWIFLIMEKMAGGELFDHLTLKKQFSETEARYIFRQLCEGTAFLHSKRIVHRDIKLENILISGIRKNDPPENTELFDVKLADFGLSKFLTDGSTARSMVGTPQYWAPEIAAAGGHSGEYCESVDLWSLGVLLYIMLRGRYPFKDSARTATAIAEIDFVSGVWSSVSNDGKDLIRGLLQENPDDRLTLQAVMSHPWYRAPLQRKNSASAEVQVMGTATLNQTTSIPSAYFPSLPPLPPPPFSQMQGAIVRWQDKAALDDEYGPDHMKSFSLAELVRFQVALAGSLELASLACRRSHPYLAADIRRALVTADDLNQRALGVVTQYGQVAQVVKEKMLPELHLAIEEAVPAMAIDLLANVTDWAQEMRKDSDLAFQKCEEFGKQLESLIAVALKEHSKVVEEQMLGPALENCPHACKSTDVACGENCVVNSKTKELFESLCAYAKSISKDEVGSNGTACSSAVLDLLFLAPGVDVSSTETAARDKNAMEVCENEVAGDGDKDDVVEIHTGMGIAPAAPEVNDRAGITNPLLQAMVELRRVGQILQECKGFWTNMDGTVREMSRLKDHMETLVKYASGNAKIRSRFDQRLAEYAKFWEGFRRCCLQYCEALEPALKTLRKQILRLEEVADKMT